VIGVSHDSVAFKFRVFAVPPEREAEVWEKFELLESILIAELNKRATAPEPSRPPARKARSRRNASEVDSA
jgi:hypothetical protein